MFTAMVRSPSRSMRAVLGVIVACLGLPRSAGAASFAVNSTADGTDGVCATTAGGCTLRDAIKAANALPDADIITLPAGTYTLTVMGAGEDLAATGDLDITGPVTINGAGAATTIIDAGRIDRVFDIFDTAGNVTIQGLTVRNGFPGLSTFGGGIWNSAVLTLSQVRVDGSEGRLGGGGIQNDGDLTANDVTLSGNMTNSQGGGLYNTGVALLERVTVSGNSSVAAAGGIQNDGTLTLTNVTISGNTAATDGGGLNNGVTATLENVTVASNGANRGGGLFTPGDVTLGNTIVANSVTGGSCNSSGTVMSLGSNLDSDGTCQFTGPGDLSGVAAGLGSLADNGGPTETHALLAGSPAIDAAQGCPPPATDQRGVARPLDGNGDGLAVCDIGALETTFQPPMTTTTMPQSTTSTTLPTTDAPIAGTKLVLKDNVAKPTKRRLLVLARDTAAGVPTGTDPTAVGASLRVVTVNGDGFDATDMLPASGWKRVGRPGRIKGYRYADPSLARGPIANVVVRNGKLLKATGRGTQLSYTLGADPNPVWIVLTIGTSRHCMSFGGSKPKFVSGKSFASRGAPRPASCELPSG
jgi:CSLREA domain-containing protein